MIRALDPLFPGLSLRLLPTRSAVRRLLHKEEAHRDARTQPADQKPRWDAPGHWFERDLGDIRNI